MDFRQEVNEFSSEVHNIIYCFAKQIVPLEFSLSKTKDEKMKDSAKALYQFVMDMLSDMYDNPLEYAFPDGELEKFANGRKINGLKQKYPSKTKTLLARTHNCVERYMVTLCMLAFCGTIRENGQNITLEIKEKDYQAIAKAVYTSTSPIKLEKRLNAFERIGLHRCEGQEYATFFSDKYPNMFYSMKKMAQATGGKCSGFPYYLFTKLDFRNMECGYLPDYEDYYRVLPTAIKEKAEQIHKMAADLGFRPVISTFLKVDYKYKGTQVLMMGSDHNSLDVRITEAYSWDNQKLFTEEIERLQKEDARYQNSEELEKLKKYALRHLWRCTACATTHLGQFIELFGMKGRVCGGGQIGFTWWNPKDEDMELIQLFLEIRCRLINQTESQKVAQKSKNK